MPDFVLQVFSVPFTPRAMILTVWILEENDADADALIRAWNAVGGKEVRLLRFSDSSALIKAAAEREAPDLLMGEISLCGDKVTELLLKWRERKSPDLFPVTSDRSPAAFTKAQQLGAIDYLLKPCPIRRLRSGLRRYLSLRLSLEGGHDLTQHLLDRFFFSGASSPARKTLRLPKEQEEKCLRIVSILSEPGLAAGGLDAEAIAMRLAVSNVTARRYLDLLEEAGYIEKQIPPTGKKGRPRTLYRLKTV